MIFVTVTVNREAHRIICVDGPFDGAEKAEDHKAVLESRLPPKYETTVQVVTSPR